MNAEKADDRLTEILRWKHFALTMPRSYCARLRRYCDNVKGLLFHVLSEPQTVWFLIALWWGMMLLRGLKVKYSRRLRGRSTIGTDVLLISRLEIWAEVCRNPAMKCFEALRANP